MILICSSNNDFTTKVTLGVINMSLQEIKVSREKVLGIVKENKEKHDLILKDAIEGYWIEASKTVIKKEKETLDLINKNHREQLKNLRKTKKDNIRNLKINTKNDLDKIKRRDKSPGFIYWGGKYPEDHGDAYNGTIRRLELCVDDTLLLNTNEFDSYIRNKWEWRDSFINTNTGYVSSYYSTGSVGISNSYPTSYAISCSYSSGSVSSLSTF
jgi:hypothetical protein